MIKGITRVEAFRTSDGLVHSDPDEARYHQARLNFLDWYLNGHKLFSDCTHVDAEEVLDWLLANRKDIKIFLDDLR